VDEMHCIVCYSAFTADFRATTGSKVERVSTVDDPEVAGRRGVDRKLFQNSLDGAV